MPIPFTKLLSSILDSSIWDEDSDIRVVWVTLMAMADRKGRVYAAIPGVAHRARVTLEKTQQAITKFLNPDPMSRTPDLEGRRIVPIDGGWQLVNYVKIRGIMDEGSIKESKRLWAERARNEKRQEACLQHAPEIPSVDEVIKAGEMLACTPELCRKFWNWHQENNMWCNTYGKLVDWRKKLVRWRENEKTPRPGRPDPSGNGQAQTTGTEGPKKSVLSPGQKIMYLKDLIKHLDIQIEEHPASNHTPWDKPSPEALESLKALKLRRKQAKDEMFSLPVES